MKPEAISRALALLEERGYIVRHKNGRRNEYELVQWRRPLGEISARS